MNAKRVLKDPDVRRDELLDHVLHLSARFGYDTLSIEQVTQAAGVAKGTFYYYFRSKTDALVALVERFADEIFEHLRNVPLDGPADARFLQLLTAATSWKTARMDDAMASVPLLYKPENLELRHRLFDSWSTRTGDLFRPLIALGAQDGSFHLPDGSDPDAITDVVMSLWLNGSTAVFERALRAPDAAAFADITLSGTQSILASVERILGARPGAFATPVDRRLVEAMYQPFLAALEGQK